MPYRDNREYRAMASFDVVPNESENYIVEGYASTFDVYDLFTSDGITYKEHIEPTAFDNCDMRDVVFLKDHEGTVFARNKNNSLQLSVDSHGLKVRADLSLTSHSREAYEEIKSGLYDQMSFAFIVAEDGDSYDRKTHTRNIHNIRKLFDVSYVMRPANNFTDISVATRSRFDGFIEDEKADLLKREQELKDAELRAEIKEMIERISKS